MSCVCYKTECPQRRKRGLRVWFVFPSISIRAPQDYRRPVGVPKTLLEELVQRARLSHRRRADTSPEEGRHQMSIEDGDHHMLNKLLLSLVARSVTPPSHRRCLPVRRWRGGTTLLQQRAPRSCNSVFVMSIGRRSTGCLRVRARCPPFSVRKFLDPVSVARPNDPQAGPRKELFEVVGAAREKKREIHARES